MDARESRTPDLLVCSYVQADIFPLLVLQDAIWLCLKALRLRRDSCEFLRLLVGLRATEYRTFRELPFSPDHQHNIRHKRQPTVIRRHNLMTLIPSGI